MKRILLTSSLALAPLASFGIIDFETGFTSDNIDVSSNIFTSGASQIQFSFTSGNPIVEDSNNNGFRTSGTVESDSKPGFGPQDNLGFITANDGLPSVDSTDTTALGYSGSTWAQPSGSGPDLGNYFLRGPSLSNFGTFVISYVNGTSSNALSFQIWDIDGTGTSGTEEYVAEFFEDDGFGGYNSLGTVTTPEYSNADVGTSLDGLPYLVAFDAGTDEITRVEITFTGTKTNNIGLAFDNFDPENIPEPSFYAAIFGVGALGVAWLRRRRAA